MNNKYIKVKEILDIIAEQESMSIQGYEDDLITLSTHHEILRIIISMRKEILKKNLVITPSIEVDERYNSYRSFIDSINPYE